MVIVKKNRPLGGFFYVKKNLKNRIFPLDSSTDVW